MVLLVGFAWEKRFSGSSKGSDLHTVGVKDPKRELRGSRSRGGSIEVGRYRRIGAKLYPPQERTIGRNLWAIDAKDIFFGEFRYQINLRKSGCLRGNGSRETGEACNKKEEEAKACEHRRKPAKRV
jgi:hypothetical protein